MTEDNRTPEEEPKVGYGEPPKSSQFKKGQSGNPAGRPKKKITSKPKNVPDFGTKGSDKLLLEEAFGPLTLREGGKTIEIPAIRAVYRSMFHKAAQGDRFARQEILRMIQRKEEEDQQKRAAHDDEILQYMKNCQLIEEEALRHGDPPPVFFPHPDDWDINPDTGELEINGPKDEEDAKRWKKSFARRDAYAESIEQTARKYRRGSDPEGKENLLEIWHMEQCFFDMINDAFPDKYQAKLKSRSDRDGATKPGDFKTHRLPRD